jgi:hypothetical protein
MHSERGLEHRELSMSALLVEAQENGDFSGLGIFTTLHED